MEEVKKNSLSVSTRNDKSLSPVTLRDLILFKEDILKEMKIYQNKIDLSISKNYEKSTQLLEASNNKLYNYEIDKALFMKQMDFIEEKNKIISLIEEKDSEAKNQLMVNDLHINTCQKELDNACFKYDRIIVDNLLIPGLVGKGCKFPFFKEYINDIQGQINIAVSQNKQNANNLTANKTNTEEKIRQLNTKIKKLEYDSKQFTNEKSILLDNKFNQMIETLNNQLTSVTGEYYKTNIELKDKVSEVKNIASLLIEENQKLNIKTLKEFEKLKKNFKYLKKTIVELSSLLTSGASFSGTGKYNKNIANNRQQIIQNFNSMIIGLMKDVTKGNNSNEFNNEINNVLFPKKKVGSLIKKYIEGKIQAEDTKFEERDKRKKNSFNRQKTINDIFNRNSAKKKVNSTPKKEELNLNYNLNSFNRLNSDSIKSGGNNNKKFNRQVSVEFNDVTNRHNFAPNNTENISKINDIFNRNKSNIHIIKEEENNKSKTIDNSISDNFDEDLNIEEENIFKNKIYSNFGDDDKISFSLRTDSFRKDKKKLFFRAQTSNYDHKKFNFGNNNNDIDNFKLLSKAQENLERKRLSSKNTNLMSQNKIKKESLDKKKNEKKDNDSKINENKKIENNKNDDIIGKIESIKINKNEDKIEDKVKIIDKIKKFENIKINKANEVNIIIDDKNRNLENKSKDKDNIEKENNININIDKNKNEIKNIVKNENKIKINSIKKEEQPLIKNQKSNTDNNNNTSPIPIKSKNLFNIKSDFQKVHINQLNQNDNQSDISKNNILPSESNFLKYSKNKNNIRNNINKTDNILSFSDTFNTNLLSSNNQYKTQDNINYNKNAKLTTLTITSKKRPLSIMNSCQTRPVSKFKIKSKFNFFNDDIYINKDLIKNINYCKDEDIIDKPLLINQTNFKVDNTKGSLENKVLELEYFTKRKLDELVREIKNFIPIHFNAYIKE